MQKLLFATCLVQFISLCLCWGPIFHQIQSSQFQWNCLQSQEAIAHCFKNSTAPIYSFILGASAPDSVKALSMRLHDFEFATVMYHFAKQYKNTTSFDPVSFSLGYGFHLAEDFVGHYSTGFLTPKFDHEIEFAVDTYAYQTYLRSQFPWSYPIALFNDDAMHFITEANEYFASQSSSPFIPFNYSSITGSISNFEKMANTEAHLVVLNKVYKSELVAFNFCKATDFETVSKQLELSIKWCQQASMQWLHLLYDNIDPKDMTKQMYQFVDSLYASHSGTIC